MKNLFTAFILAIALAGVSLANTTVTNEPIVPNKTSIAVVEFTPGPAAADMSFEAKRHFQAAIAFKLAETRQFHIPDVRNTREASKANLAAINGKGPTAAAVKLGKQMGVSYVLTGNISEYNKTASGTYGRATFHVRLIEVATGKVAYSGEISHQSTAAILGRSGEADMMVKVLKPGIQKLTSALVGLNL